MPTQILAPGQTESYSSEITIGADQEVTIQIYSDNGGGIPYGPTFRLQRKTILNNFEDVATIDMGRVVLKSDLTVLVLSASGTYRVYRPDISAFGVNIGVQTG